MNWATMITTAPRPGADPHPLAGCLDGLEKAGWTDPVVFAEPDSPSTSNSVSRHQHIERYGAWRNWICGLERMLRLFPDADAILAVQDDVELVPGARTFLEWDLWPAVSCGLVQLATSMAYGWHSAGMHRLGTAYTHQLCGAWAMAIPRHVAYQIVDYAKQHGWRGTPLEGTEVDDADKACIDLFVGQVLIDLGYSAWVCRPGLATHLDVPSTLGHGRAMGSRKTIPVVEGIPARPDTSWMCAPCGRVWLPYGSQASHLPVAIVLVATEFGQELDRCLRALCGYRTLLIENGVTLPDHGARKLHNNENLGYSVAVNQGVVQIPPDRDILLVNSDCVVAPNCVSMLIHTLALHPDAAAVGPVTMDNGHQSLRRPERRKRAEARDRNQPTEEDMLAFFCVLIRRSAWDAVGPLDEAFPHGLCADDDWCMRARANGWKLLCQPAAYAEHEHAATFKALGIDRVAAEREARKMLEVKHVL